jgi:hypothetical protein
MVAAKLDAIESDTDTKALEPLVRLLSLGRTLRAGRIVSATGAGFRNDPIFEKNF